MITQSLTGFSWHLKNHSQPKYTHLTNRNTFSRFFRLDVLFQIKKHLTIIINWEPFYFSTSIYHPFPEL